MVHNDIPDTERDSGRGVLMEVLRADEPLFTKFGQSVFTISYGRGTIKGFHWHRKQDDLWFIASGKARVVLYDMRDDSPTKNETQVIEAGTRDYKLIFIPHGVAHGYKVLTDDPLMLVYHVTEVYDPSNPDEGRIAYNDPLIGYNWDADDK